MTQSACRSLRARRSESINLPDFIQFATVALLGGCFWYQVGTKPTSTSVQNTLGESFCHACAMHFPFLTQARVAELADVLG